MSGILIGAGLVAVAAGVYLVGKGKSQPVKEDAILQEPVEITDQIVKKDNKKEEKKEVVMAEEKKVPASDEKKDKALYYWLNNLAKQMFYHYRNDKWNTFVAVEPFEESDFSIDKIKENLGKQECKLLDDILANVFLTSGNVENAEGLKEVFFDMILPFYPQYYYVFENDIRYTAFLNKKTLNLFHQLSGKKFRVGYRNRFSTGVTGFEWTGDQYRVYQKDGTLVCDATFKDHKLYDGYGSVRVDEQADEDWKIEKTGLWKEGSFVSGKMHYIYQKPCK